MQYKSQTSTALLKRGGKKIFLLMRYKNCTCTYIFKESVYAIISTY